MPVIITKNNVEYSLVPAPLVTFNKQVYNNVGRPGLGTDFTITLQGTLLPTHGNPYYYATGDLVQLANTTTAWTTSSEVESAEVVNLDGLKLLDVTIKKQEYIRNLFTNPIVNGRAQPIKVQIRGWNEAGITASTGLTFYAFVDDISFDADSRWANPTTYSINLRTSSFEASSANTFTEGSENLEIASGYFISNLTETFDVQEDGRTTLTFATDPAIANSQNVIRINKVYTINRSITAVGSPIYDANGNYDGGHAPWQQASGFIHTYLKVGGGVLVSGLSGIANEGVRLYCSGISYSNPQYRAGNFVYQESIDREAGSYTLSETYTLFSGVYPVIETVTINQDISENGTRSFSVQGNIQGINTVQGFASSGDAFFNAQNYFLKVIDTGIPATPYYYARYFLTYNDGAGIVTPWLHPRPLNQSIARDLNAGTISYTYNFDDRPANIVPGSISESIQINDTYPGELFSVTPVIGRSQPVLQYLNSRSEYKRNLSINITMAQTGSPAFGVVNNFGNIINSSDRRIALQRMFFNEKPSISQTAALNDIFQSANPVNDPTFIVANGKCFHSAPTETWDPRTRNYSYSIEWTYERFTNV